MQVRGNCPFEHSGAVAALNSSLCARRTQKLCSAAAVQPTCPKGVTYKNGRLIEYDYDKGFGWVVPDAARGGRTKGLSKNKSGKPIGSGKKVFMHRTGWVAAGSSFPQPGIFQSVCGTFLKSKSRGPTVATRGQRWCRSCEQTERV